MARIRLCELISTPLLMLIIVVGSVFVFMAAAKLNLSSELFIGLFTFWVIFAIRVYLEVEKRKKQPQPEDEDRVSMFDLTDLINLLLPFLLIAVLFVSVFGLPTLNLIQDFIKAVQDNMALAVGAVIILTYLFLQEGYVVYKLYKSNQFLGSLARKRGLKFKPGYMRVFSSKAYPSLAVGEVGGNKVTVTVGLCPKIMSRKYNLEQAMENPLFDRTVIELHRPTAGVLFAAAKRADFIDGVPTCFVGHVKSTITEKIKLDSSFSDKLDVFASAKDYAAAILTQGIQKKLVDLGCSLYVGGNQIILGWNNRPKSVEDLQKKFDAALEIAKEIRGS